MGFYFPTCRMEVMSALRVELHLGCRKRGLSMLCSKWPVATHFSSFPSVLPTPKCPSTKALLLPRTLADCPTLLCPQSNPSPKLTKTVSTLTTAPHISLLSGTSSWESLLNEAICPLWAHCPPPASGYNQGGLLTSHLLHRKDGLSQSPGSHGYTASHSPIQTGQILGMPGCWPRHPKVQSSPEQPPLGRRIP